MIVARGLRTFWYVVREDYAFFDVSQEMDPRASSGKILRVQSRYPESFRFLGLCPPPHTTALFSNTKYLYFLRDLRGRVTGLVTLCCRRRFRIFSKSSLLYWPWNVYIGYIGTEMAILALKSIKTSVWSKILLRGTFGPVVQPTLSVAPGKILLQTFRKSLPSTGSPAGMCHFPLKVNCFAHLVGLSVALYVCMCEKVGDFWPFLRCVNK